MKLKTKQLIAKEFLLSLIILVVWILSYLGIVWYNNQKINNIKESNKIILLLKDSLTNNYSLKIKQNVPYNLKISRRKEIFEKVSQIYDLGSFVEFDQKMNIANKQKIFYEAVSKDFYLGEFEYFVQFINNQIPITETEYKKAMNDFKDSIKSRTFFHKQSFIESFPVLRDDSKTDDWLVLINTSHTNNRVLYKSVWVNTERIY